MGCFGAASIGTAAYNATRFWRTQLLPRRESCCRGPNPSLPFSTISAPQHQQQPMAGDAGDQNLAFFRKMKKPAAPVRPSSSILLLSPTNQVLLLHRVQTSTSFASAHVFPGGNLSSFHDGPLPDAEGPALHEDGPAYRLAAIRETFEESGILLARKPGQTRDGGLLHVPDDAREAGRKQVHGNQVRFTDWLRSVGGEPDVDNLIPFTRWITPHGPPKRFTTQMYLYMLPLAGETLPTTDLLLQRRETIVPVPTHDGGVEHTAAAWDDASAWLARARAGDIILFPPQFYLLYLVSQFLRAPPSLSPPPPASSSPLSSSDSYRAQRSALLSFLGTTPTAASQRSATSPGGTAEIPWSAKVMSPAALFVRRADGRLVLGLDKPGPELRGSGRGGDRERVVLVRFQKDGPRDVEVRSREEVLREEREWEERESERGDGGEDEKGGSKL